MSCESNYFMASLILSYESTDKKTSSSQRHTFDIYSLYQIAALDLGIPKSLFRIAHPD